MMAWSTFRTPNVINHISGGLTSADNVTKMATVRCLSALTVKSLHDFMMPYWNGFSSTLFGLLDDQTTPHLLVKEIQHTMTLIHSIISPSDRERYHLASLAWIEYKDVADESARYIYYQLVRPSTETLRAASQAKLDTSLEEAPIGLDGMLSVHAAARVLAQMQDEAMGKLTEQSASHNVQTIMTRMARFCPALLVSIVMHEILCYCIFLNICSVIEKTIIFFHVRTLRRMRESSNMDVSLVLTRRTVPHAKRCSRFASRHCSAAWE